MALLILRIQNKKHLKNSIHFTFYTKIRIINVTKNYTNDYRKIQNYIDLPYFKSKIKVSKINFFSFYQPWVANTDSICWKRYNQSYNF